MTNQDEKPHGESCSPVSPTPSELSINEEIIKEVYDRLFPEFEKKVIKGNMETWEFQEKIKQEICNKARQQGANNMREKLHKEGVDLCCSDCDKVKEARQQGIDNTIIECEKKKELWIDRERKSVYEQGRKDGIEAERKRIIEMIAEIIGNNSSALQTILKINIFIEKLKNSEAMEK